MALQITTTKQFLDAEGLQALITKIKAADTAVDNKLTGEINGVKSDVSDLQDDVDDIKEALGATSDGSITSVDDKIDSALEELVGKDSFKVSYADKTITIELNGEERTVDASDFVKDSFVKAGKVEGTKLVLTLITVDHPGATGTESTVEIEVGSLLTDLSGKVTALEGTVGDASKGLVKQVNDIDAAYKSADTALGDRITALEGVKDAYKAADDALEEKITTAYESYADTQAETAYNSITAIPAATVTSMFG